MTRHTRDRAPAPLADDALVRLLGARAFDREAVEEAARAAADILPRAAQRALKETGLAGLGQAVLLEGQFGPGHFTLSRSRRVYYRDPAACCRPRPARCCAAAWSAGRAQPARSAGRWRTAS